MQKIHTYNNNQILSLFYYSSYKEHSIHYLNFVCISLMDNPYSKVSQVSVIAENMLLCCVYFYFNYVLIRLYSINLIKLVKQASPEYVFHSDMITCFDW